MGDVTTAIDGIVFTRLRRIETSGGDVFHAMKASDPGYVGFGEAYFTTIVPGAVKPWKRHHLMTLNLVVIAGRVRFAVFDDRPESPSRGRTATVDLDTGSQYGRLTIAPKLWFAFRSISPETGVVLNLADRIHNDGEVDRKSLDDIPFDWGI